MVEMDLHCQVVQNALVGGAADDEQTFASLEVLSERLEQLKKLDKAFSSVTFSRYAKNLARQKNRVAVC